MNKLPLDRRAAIIRALVEGNSIRATCRITNTAKGTVLKLLADVGEACLAYQREAFQSLPCRRIEVDEIWSFTYAKEKNLPEQFKGRFGYGDTWTFIGIDAETKLVPLFMVGPRNATTAKAFMVDLAARLAHRIQLTTDAHKMYLSAVEEGFGADVDFAQLQKHYGNEAQTEARYSPPKVVGTAKQKINGEPKMANVSTSYVERQNLTLRMQNRRFTRLTNAFSRKVENLRHSLAIHFFHYNFCRVHQSLRVTPCMEAKIADRIWEVEEIAQLAG